MLVWLVAIIATLFAVSCPTGAELDLSGKPYSHSYTYDRDRIKQLLIYTDTQVGTDRTDSDG